MVLGKRDWLLILEFKSQPTDPCRSACIYPRAFVHSSVEQIIDAGFDMEGSKLKLIEEHRLKCLNYNVTNKEEHMPDVLELGLGVDSTATIQKADMVWLAMEGTLYGNSICTTWSSMVKGRWDKNALNKQVSQICALNNFPKLKHRTTI